MGIFGSKTAEVSGGWRKLSSVDFYNSYILINIVRVSY
jgi:hypothetical protein